MTARSKVKLKHGFLYSLLAIVGIIFGLPTVWLVLTSIKPERLTYSATPIWFFKPTIENFMDLLQKTYFPQYFLNSAIITLSTVGFAVTLGTLAGYSLSRFRIKGASHVSFWIISTRMFPPIAVVTPLYLIYQKAALLDSYIGMILIYTAFSIPYVVWMMKGFLDAIPIEIEEAALVDGCSHLAALFRVVFPLLLPGMFATALFVFVITWNEFLIALIITGMEAKTLPVAIAALITDRGIQWGKMCATASGIMLPVMAFFYIIQKHLLTAFTFGAVKG